MRTSERPPRAASSRGPIPPHTTPITPSSSSSFRCALLAPSPVPLAARANGSQVSLIIVVCHLLHWPLAKIRQPRVIAEVVGGIILGPSVMGRIPGFQQAIFPQASLPILNLVANLGLVLYLFLIGLETDVGFLLSNWRVAASVSLAGLALPFGLGCALAWGVYQAFRGEAGLEPIKFQVYMLFVGIAIAITVPTPSALPPSAGLTPPRPFPFSAAS